MTVTTTSVVRRAWANVLSYFVKFGVVGLVGVGIDVGIFNLLRLGDGVDAWWINGAIGAKVVSTSIAIIANWLGNRFWTFRLERHKHIAREFVEFVVASLVGMGVTLACLWISHYVLGLTTLAEDNISANVVGLALGTLARFVLYRFWVWSPKNAGKTGVSIND
jgi:putative flippase GtrA